MKPSCRALVILGVMSLHSSAASAQTEVRNDSFDQNQAQRIGTAQLIEGEMYAADFVLPASVQLPVELLGVRVVMVADPSRGAQNACGRFHVEVWEDTQPASPPPNDCPLFSHEEPGAVIYSMNTQFGAAQRDIAFELRGDPNNYQDLLFSSITNNPQLMATIPPVMLTRREVRVGLRTVDLACGARQGDYFPLMLTDTNGEQGTNYLYGYLKDVCPPSSARFYYWRSFAPLFQVQPGDFVMRLLLRAPSMGSPDLGEPDMMVVDLGPDGSMDMTPVDMASAQDMMAADMRPPRDMASPGEDMARPQPDMRQPQPSSPLQIKSVSPSSASADASTELVIVGEGFVAGMEISLDARKIGVVEVRSGRALATVPSGLPVKAYDVIVTNPSGQTAVAPAAFTITPGSANPLMPSPAQGRATGAEEGCACAQPSGARPGARGAWAMALLVLGAAAGRPRRRNRSGRQRV